MQRQYLGCVGKVDNGIVTVHVGVAKGCFQALWTPICICPNRGTTTASAAGRRAFRMTYAIVPSGASRWSNCAGSAKTACVSTGSCSTRATGAAVPFLQILNLVGQQFVAEVPVNFTVRDRITGKAKRADQRLTADDAKAGRRFRLKRKTTKDSVWRATKTKVFVAGRQQTLIVAINEATAEVKYFVTNAMKASLAQVLTVAFRRWTVEHGFRLGKQEAGLMHYEGRDYLGLMRHLIMSLVVLGFVATHTERLRGEKSKDHGGASVPGANNRGARRSSAVAAEFRKCGTPATSSATTSDETNRRQSRTRNSGIDVSSKAALYC